MEALKEQVGGAHYKNLPFQPVELFAKTKCSAFQANIWKYITRYKYKDGWQDIRKCRHYAKLALELNCNCNISNDSVIEEFCRVNKLSPIQASIVRNAANNKYESVIKDCERLLLNLLFE